MKSHGISPIVGMVSRGVVPVMQLFGLYVIAHGHYSPGGGFQGGAMLAASVLLVRMGVGQAESQAQFRASLNAVLGAIGALIFTGTGIWAMLAGGEFLNYGVLPIPGFSGAELRSFAILLIEVGVGLAVMTILALIYDELMEADVHG